MFKNYKILLKQTPRPYQLVPYLNPNSLDVFAGSPVLAVDFETRGTDPLAPTGKIVCVGISNGTVGMYIPAGSDGVPPAVWSLLHSKKVVMHNAVFDAVWYMIESSVYPNIAMCTYGMFKYLATENWVGQKWSLKVAMTDILGWPEANTQDLDAWLKSNKLSKEDMWQVPMDILGPYCAADAVATAHLWQYFTSVLTAFPDLVRFHANEFLKLVELLIWQQTAGFKVDTLGIKAYSTKIEEEIVQSEKQLLECDEVRPHVIEYNRLVVQQLMAKEPAMLTQKGKPSVLWNNWKERVTTAATTNHFNINSKTQIGWLFYDRLGYKPERKTDSGKAAIDSKILPKLGEVGKALHKHNKLVKVGGYVHAAITNIRNNSIHPRFKNPGTVTGRLSGDAGFNLQQQPKTREYLQNFVARPGHVFISTDLNSLEPKIQAQFSGDTSLLKLYGPGQPENDIYLFNGAHMYGIKDEILRYYDPNNPTPDTIAAAKKACKATRFMVKTFTLAAGYGAYWPKLKEGLLAAGVQVTDAQVQQMFNDYWTLYKGIKRFGRALEEEWTARGGWVYNGCNRPLAVDFKFKKDLVNRFVQSTGHDVLMTYIKLIATNNTIGMRPIIVDYHDETIWEVADAYVNDAVALFNWAMAELNKTLGWNILMSGTPVVGRNLADIKCE